MTKQEIEKKINWVKDQIWYEEMADFGYDFCRVGELKKELRELEKLLEEMA